jgi:hypothetical protein
MSETAEVKVGDGANQEYKDSEVNQNLVKALEALLQYAKEGKIIGLISLAIASEEITCARIVHLMHHDTLQMIGSIEACKRDLLSFLPNVYEQQKAQAMNAQQAAQIDAAVKSVIQKSAPRIVRPRGNA